MCQKVNLGLPHPTVPSSAVQPSGTQRFGQASWQEWRCNWSMRVPGTPVRGPHTRVRVQSLAGVSSLQVRVWEGGVFLAGNGKHAWCCHFAKSPVPPRSAGEHRLVCRWEMHSPPPPLGRSVGLCRGAAGREGRMLCSALLCSALPWHTGKTPCSPRSVRAAPCQGPLAGTALRGHHGASLPRRHTVCAEPRDGNRQKDLGGQVTQ